MLLLLLSLLLMQASHPANSTTVFVCGRIYHILHCFSVFCTRNPPQAPLICGLMHQNLPQAPLIRGLVHQNLQQAPLFCGLVHQNLQHDWWKEGPKNEQLAVAEEAQQDDDDDDDDDGGDEAPQEDFSQKFGYNLNMKIK